MDEYRQAIAPEAPRTLENTGALYVYNNYIFINEQKEGIHIVDNTDPENPTPIAFLKIPGNFNMGIRNNLLYADNFVDLVVMDISDPLDVKFAGRTENVFDSYQFYQDLGYLVYYEESEETVELSCSDLNFGNDFFWMNDGRLVFDAAFSNNAEALSPNVSFDQGGNSIGQAGSLARFSIIDKYLYSISEYDLRIFDLEDPVAAELASTVNIGWGIETIFPYQDNLFIGADHGMYIYDNSDPLNPTQLSLFTHARACDPVYVQGNTAYVTLRDGTECEGFDNQLDVVDITDLSNPKLLASHQMSNPHGLSIRDENLYLCDGRFGFKVYDVSDWRLISSRQLAHVPGFSAFDVITVNGKDLAIVIGEDGLYQFDISDPADPVRLSVLSTGSR
ncbi:hypothetical protein CRP01_09935 [Flavilitoribacter nigricans DSM 23189 = NBRC 102662]|uniref:LVIVD repeat-containing protein n=2 Tax=Flavilitoribacter TaxID=2762562 RepID=A0A2D0NEL1_FLAN2|nr:hypothetical protein CRP01_09935 [Flavilitoribacter nigricans DSM 23189 = NBRC 102662]